MRRFVDHANTPLSNSDVTVCITYYEYYLSACPFLTLFNLSDFWAFDCDGRFPPFLLRVDAIQAA